jgi:hypothetical protein
MPAFTFEKISPPINRDSVQPAGKSSTNKSNTDKNNTKKQRKLIVQILDRFAEVRVRRSLRAERSAIARNKSKTSD